MNYLFQVRAAQTLRLVLTPDNDLNEAFYGIKARDVLNGGVSSTPDAVLIFPQALSRY